MNEETKIQRRIMILLSKEGHSVWRNETGRFWTGKPIHKDGQTVTLANAMMIPVGLCVGSSDLITITPTVITQEMVGSTVGVFGAIEVKTKKGRASKEQLNYIDHVQKMGGLAGIARSPQEALEILNKNN